MIGAWQHGSCRMSQAGRAISAGAATGGMAAAALGMACGTDADGSFDRFLAKLARTDVLAIDDWGLVPMTDMERRHFLEILEDRCEARSTVMTSQFPTDSWHDLIGSPTLADAIVERMLTNSHKIELKGETMRPLKEPVASDKGKRTGSQQKSAKEETA